MLLGRQRIPPVPEDEAQIGRELQEVEFAGYESINGFPVATEIRFYDSNGKLSMIEKYFNITPGCKVPSGTYSPSNFNNARW